MRQHRHNDDLELGEVLQAELIRRVMALEGREETLRVNNAKLETTIEALDECTKLSREEIVAIAQELSRSASSYDVAAGVHATIVGRKLPTIAQASVLVGVLACAATAYVVLKPAPDIPRNVLGEGNVVIYEQYHRKAELVSAMADVSPLRMMLLEHFYNEGVFPDSIEELGYESELLVSKNVTSVTLESEGTLVVHLPESFGNNKHVKLAPNFAMGGTIIQWDCTANLPTSVLTGIDCKQG